MATLQSDWAKGTRIARTSGVSGQVICETYEYAITAALYPSTNDIIEIGALPGNNEVVDMILDCDDLDGATALLLDVGIMSGDYGDSDSGGARTVDDVFFDGSDLGQAGGIARMTLQGGFNVASTDADRGIGVKIATEAGTDAAGSIRLKVWYAAV